MRKLGCEVRKREDKRKLDVSGNEIYLMMLNKMLMNILLLPTIVNCAALGEVYRQCFCFMG